MRKKAKASRSKASTRTHAPVREMSDTELQAVSGGTEGGSNEFQHRMPTDGSTTVNKIEAFTLKQK